MRPGVEILSADTAPGGSVTPTDYSVAFISTIAEKGSHLIPTRITSLDGFVAAFGNRVTNGYGYDVLDQAFREGLATAYVIRAVGPAPVFATLNLAAATSGTALVVNAKSVGSWANGTTGGLSVIVQNGPSGAGYRQLVIRLNGVQVEISPEYPTATANADLAAWSASSSYVDITVGGGTGAVAVAAAANLASGADDVGNITDMQWAASLAKFGAALGPGQVCMPGRTTTQAHLDTLSHADANNRVAILDAPDSAVKATLQAAAAALTAASTSARRHGGLFSPWIKVAGGTALTTRLVPPSASVIGKLAATDRVEGPGQPPAGAFGISSVALDLTASFTDADAQDLEAPEQTGLSNPPINLLRNINGTIMLYGFRALVRKDQDPNWWALTWGRVDMAIKAMAREIADRYVFRQIDGRDQTINAFAGELESMLFEFYRAGTLYADPNDDRPGTAFRVDVGAQVNTEVSKANGELKAVLLVRMSPFAELVRITVTKVLSTQSVG